MCIISNPPFFFLQIFLSSAIWSAFLIRTHVRPFGLYKRSYQPAHTSPPAPPPGLSAPSHLAPSAPRPPLAAHPAPSGPTLPHPAPPGPPRKPRPAPPGPPLHPHPGSLGPAPPTKKKNRWRRQDGLAHVWRGGYCIGREALVRRAGA